MWRQFCKSIRKNWGNGFTIFIVPNSSHGKIANWKLPFSALLIILGIILFNLAILVGFPTQVWVVYRCRYALSEKNRQIAGLKRARDQVLPNLQKSRQLETELGQARQAQARLTSLWRTIQQKNGHSVSFVSRGGVVRVVPYQMAPPPATPDAVVLPDKLQENLEQLNGFLHKEESEQNNLLRELGAYQRRLDCTPSLRPVRGSIVSPFGIRFHPIYHRYIGHEGVDIAIGYGTPVRAAAAGIVIFSGWESGYGRLITIDHGYGIQTRYGHNSRLLVSQGARVLKGQVISLSGSSGESTGPHLHFEVRRNGTPINPVSYLKE